MKILTDEYVAFPMEAAWIIIVEGLAIEEKTKREPSALWEETSEETK
jgi:hypothetical protein